MAKYQISVGVRQGAGTAIINGLPIDPAGYEEGLTLSFNWDTEINYSAISITTRGNYIPFSTAPSFTFTMPSRDVTFFIALSFWEEPTLPYGLKYYYEFGNTVRDCKRIEILERNYTGASEVRQLNSVIRRFGDRDANPIDTFIYSSLDITFVASNTEYFEFITGDIRKFQVILKYGDVVKFKGYIKPDYITSPEKTNVNHEIKLTAFDGMDDFQSIRFEPAKIRNSVSLEGFAPFSQPAIKAIATALNQSYQEGRPINISCDFYENRMNPINGLFDQWVYGENGIFNDGKNPRFITDVGRIVINEYLELDTVLTRLVNPFLCNIFIWDDEFYIIRVDELTKPNLRFFKYQADSAFIESYTIPNNQIDNCILSNGLRTGRTVYNEFLASLNLGVLLPEARGGEFSYNFQLSEWNAQTLFSTINYSLKYWSYVNAVSYSVQGDSPRTGNIAGIQYYVSGETEYCRIWTTSTNAGLADPNLSYIERSVSNTGQEGRGSRAFNRGFAFIPFEDANIIAFDANWVLRKRYASSTNKPPIGTFQVAFQIQVGRYYLIQVGDLFQWTLTPNIIAFGVDASIDTTNEIKLVTDPIIEAGELIVRLYQLINLTDAKDLYMIDWEFANVNIQENESLVLSEIQKQFNTASPYSKIFEKYETFLGDSISNQSTSAMRLLSGDVTETWGEDATGLLDNVVQSLANLFGRSNVSVYGNMVREIWNPYKALQYKGRYWKINHLEINETKGEVSNIDLFDLGEIEAPLLDVVLNYQSIENPPFIDCNLRIYVNEVLLVESWSNSIGTLNLQIGDNVRIQYFYLANLIDSGVVNPWLQLYINTVLIEDNQIIPTVGQTRNYSFTITEEISILARSIDKG